MKRFLIGMVIAGLAFAVPFLVRADDQEIAKNIVQQIQEHKEAGRLKGFGIDLQVDKGTVLLTGEIASLEQMDLVLSAVNETDGVLKVVNKLAVKAVAVQPATGNSVLDGADRVLESVERKLTTQLAGTVGTTVPVEKGAKSRRPAARIVRTEGTRAATPVAPDAGKVLSLPAKALNGIENTLGQALGVTEREATANEEEAGSERKPAARVVRGAAVPEPKREAAVATERKPAARVINGGSTEVAPLLPNVLKPAQSALRSIEGSVKEALGGNTGNEDNSGDAPAVEKPQAGLLDDAGQALRRFDGVVDQAIEPIEQDGVRRAPTSARGNVPAFNPVQFASNEEPAETGEPKAFESFDPLAGIGSLADGVGSTLKGVGKGASDMLTGGARGTKSKTNGGLLGELHNSISGALGLGKNPVAASTNAIAEDKTVAQQIRTQVAGAFEAKPTEIGEPASVRAVGNEAELAAPSDREIAKGISTILGSLKASGRLTKFSLHMSVKDGQVTMKGHVPSRQQRDLALAAASKVQGVLGVIHQIDIQLPLRENIAQQVPGIAQVPLAAVGVVGAAANQLLPAQQPQGQPAPMMAPPHMASAPSGMMRARYDHPQVPGYSWPTYASYPNYAGVTYPKQYSPSAWPYIGPFYPYPQVPLGWRRVTLEWDDGWWYLDFSSRR